MGIGWLWHFARPDDDDILRDQNEYRAAVFYARWRALCRFTKARVDRVRDAQRNRRAKAEMDALPNHVLHDLGLKRGSDGVVFAVLRMSADKCQLPLESGMNETSPRRRARAALSAKDTRTTDAARLAVSPQIVMPVIRHRARIWPMIRCNFSRLLASPS